MFLITKVRFASRCLVNHYLWYNFDILGLFSLLCHIKLSPRFMEDAFQDL